MNKPFLRWSIGLIVLLVSTVIYQWPDDQLHIIACDVGQGDGLLITQRFMQVIIDGGESNGRMSNCLSQRLPFWDHQIEMMILSHPQSDHFGGLTRILDTYTVDTFLASNVVNNTAEFAEFQQAVAQQARRKVIAQAGKKIVLGEMIFEVIWPQERYHSSKVYEIDSEEITQISAEDMANQPSDVNDASTVIKLSFGDVTTLFTGDISEDVESRLMENHSVGEVDILKVPHHGSKTASSDVFINTVKPKITIIQSSVGNRYGHPHKIVTDRLSEIGAISLRNDEQGTIEIISDGSSLELK